MSNSWIYDIKKLNKGKIFINTLTIIKVFDRI